LNFLNLFKKVKISNRSISNLKSHLGRGHHLERFLTESQKTQMKRNPTLRLNKKIGKKEKSDLDQLALDAIVADSCAFNVFSKPGMKAFIEHLKPGYTPLSRHTAAKQLKKKYRNYALIKDL
jgi:hypothetical protein